MKRLHLILIVGAVVIATLLYLRPPTFLNNQGTANLDTESMAVVRRGDFSRKIELVAQVESQKQIYLGAPFNAKLAVIADDGQAVKAGDEIAQLETQDIEDRLEEKKLELQGSISTLSEHDRNQQATLVGLNAQVQTALNSVALTKLALKQLQVGTPSEELKKLKLQYHLTQSAFERAKNDKILKEKLEARGMSSRLDVLQAKLQVSQRQEDFEVARAQYDVAKKGATPLALQIARTELSIAEDNLNWARQEKQIKTKTASLERKKKRLTRDAAQAEVTQRQKQLKAAVIKAPQAGNVVLNKSFTREGLKQVAVGDEVFEGNPFVSVADLAKVRLQGEIDEILLRYIQIGMPVEVRIPSIKGKKFKAKIQSIGVLAHDRSGRQNTSGLSKVFDLSLLPESHDVFSPGTTVDVVLSIQKVKQALLLNREAVHRSPEGHFVYLLGNKKQPVTLGATNPDEVVILEGLSEGQTVMLPNKEDNAL